MTLPIPKGILAQHVVALGKTRSGKSSAMRVLVEQLLDDRRPVCIIDPKGDWYGIKLSADGKGPGYPVVIFGGEHADVPITEHAGAHVAELFATGNRPCLVDLGGWMIGPRTRFWIDFASTLFKHTKGERWLVIDEVHNFAPKGKLDFGDAGKMLHWTNRLASEGLGKGLAMLIASQRPQKVHNDTLTSCETLIAMRVLHPSDRGAVADWIKGCGNASGAEVLDSLANLARGEAWGWSPEIGFGPKRISFPMFKTYDSFRPQSVAASKGLRGWAEVDLEEVRRQLAAVVEEATANDPRELRRTIAGLERELEALRRAPPPLASADELDRARREARAAALREMVGVGRDFDRILHDLLRQVDQVKSHADGLARRVEAHAGEIAGGIETLVSGSMMRCRDAVATALEGAAAFGRVHAESAPPARAPIRNVPSAPARREEDDGAPRPVQQRILDALAELESLGARKPSRELVALLSDYTHLRSKGFQNAVSALSTAGLIYYPDGGTVALSDAGRARANRPDRARSPAEIQDRITALLGGASKRILDPLIRAYPESMTRDQVLVAAGYGHARSKGFQNAVSRLHTLGFVEYPPGRGLLRADPVLFLEGERR